jgi:predicted aspartyl protease
MIIAGIITDTDQLWVSIKVSGYHRSKDIFFRIDTGFDGELSIPISLAVPLGLPLVGESEYSVAGGGTTKPMKFIASIQWGSQNKLVSTDVDNTSTPLLGMKLLHNYTLLADFSKKSLIIKESEEKPEEEKNQEAKG